MENILSEPEDWDELFELITDDQLTPIIGKEIYRFRDGENLILLDEYLSQKLLGHKLLTHHSTIEAEKQYRKYTHAKEGKF